MNSKQGIASKILDTNQGPPVQGKHARQHRPKDFKSKFSPTKFNPRKFEDKHAPGGKRKNPQRSKEFVPNLTNFFNNNFNMQ